LHNLDPSSKSLLSHARGLLRESAGLYLTDPDRAFDVAHQVREIAEAGGDQDLLGESLLELGKVLRQRSDLLGAQQHFERAYTIYKSTANESASARALQALGTTYSASGKLEQAADCFAKALLIARRANDWYTIQRILNSWGIVYIRIGDYASALQSLEECYETLKKHPDLYLESSVALNIGAIFQRSGDHEVALDYFNRSLALGRELSDDRHIASSLIFLGDTALTQNNYTAARAHLKEATSLSKTRGYHDLQAQALKSLAELALATNQPEEALTYLLPAKQLLSPTHDRIYLQKIEQQMGACFIALKKMDKASDAIKRSLELALEIGSPQLLYEINVLASELCAKQLDYKQANVHLHEALRQHEVLFSETNQKAVRDMELRMAIEARRREQENGRTKVNGSEDSVVASA